MQTLHKKIKFSIKDFFSKCDHLLKKSLAENLTFCGLRVFQELLPINCFYSVATNLYCGIESSLYKNERKT